MENILLPHLPTLVITTEAEHYVALDKTFVSPRDSLTVAEAIVLACSALDIEEPEHYMLVDPESQKHWLPNLVLPNQDQRFTRLILVRKDAEPYRTWSSYAGEYIKEMRGAQ